MKKDDCIFCKLANGEIPTNVLYEDDVVKVIFDAEPVSRGHVLILPKEHFDNIYSIDDNTAGHVFQVAAKLSRAIKQSLECEGINILQNNEEPAGQTVFHFHMHIIPRYADDGFDMIFNHGKITNEKVKELRDKIQSKLD